MPRDPALRAPRADRDQFIPRRQLPADLALGQFEEQGGERRGDPLEVGERQRAVGVADLDAVEVTRTLTIVLPESDWHALRSVEPDAIAWLQELIRERLSSVSEPAGPLAPPSRSPSDSFWGGDKY